MTVIAALACSPTWIFGLVDPAAGLSSQLQQRLGTVVHKLRPEAMAAEALNLCTFGSDVGFYFEQVAGKAGTLYRLGLVAVALPIAYAVVCAIAHVVRRPLGSMLAAASGTILLTYYFVSLLFYDQIPAANYAPLHCVFAAAYGAFCVDAGTGLARLARHRRVPLTQPLGVCVFALPLAAVLLSATIRRLDQVRDAATSINAQAERAAAHYVLEHPRLPGTLMTTSYNLAGVLDSLGQETLHPVQAQTLFQPCSGESDAATRSCVERRLRWVLGHEDALPLRLLVPAVVTVVDWPSNVHNAMPDALRSVAAGLDLDLSVEASFATPDKTEVLRLYRVDHSTK